MNANERVVVGGRDSFMTVRHLRVRGTNFEIGRQLGEIAIERHGQTVHRFASDPVYVRARRVYFQRHFPIHWERVRGVAAAFGLDPCDARYDFTGLLHNVDLPDPVYGCSVVYYPPVTTSTGRGYLSRNYDFSLGTMADVMHLPAPSGVNRELPPVMREPYLMEWHPTDGGYSSLAMHAFDTLAGTLDGLNSAGLAVSIMADEEAMAALGPHLEVQPGPLRVIGLHELAVMRLLLDTCATVAEAKETLLTIKQHYRYVPCHYIVADRAGHSFIYENSTGRNVQHIIDGTGQPQVVTNFQVHQHPTADTMPAGALTLETNAFWRYQLLASRLADHGGLFTVDDLKANNACVNVLKVVEAMAADPAQHSITAGVQARTLWHSLYDQAAGSVEISFYLGDAATAGGVLRERRSRYLEFVLEPD